MKISFDIKTKKIIDIESQYSNMASKYGINSYCLTYNKESILPISGEFHFSRCPNEFWRRELLKMKATGITMIATYVFWNLHEVSDGVFNFSGDRDIKAFLKICSELSLPVILRIGPWCHGEMVRGGFPKWINKMPGKRKNEPKYLDKVSRFWTKLYGEVKEYLDGETIVGIQLENEYGGSIEHIEKLREIAEKIGYKVPYFTMTLWPSNIINNRFLPMMGGYPEAPWTQHKKALNPNGRYAITQSRVEMNIGTDLFKSQKNEVQDYDVPALACEIGPGNQVTQHRRPYINGRDGYGVPFAKFASGVNLLGYYMYHGGRNPNDNLWQESRRTLYPNNYPIIDYDFHAPIGRFGDCRLHGKMLKNMHTFINTFDKNIAEKVAYFYDLCGKSEYENGIYSSIRCNESGEGYHFISTYDRQFKFKDIEKLDTELVINGKSVALPVLSVKSGTQFFYPFNLKIGNINIDYITAQPFTKIKEDKKEKWYFIKDKNIRATISVNGEISELDVNKVGCVFTSGGVDYEIIILEYEKALNTYNVNNKLLFTNGTVEVDNSEIRVEVKGSEKAVYGGNEIKVDGVDCKDLVSLTKINKVKLPHNHYLYSHGKRHYYSLKIDKSILDKYYDVEISLNFRGLNLQMFSNGVIIDDYFNSEGKYKFRLKEFEKYLDKDNEFIIKAVPSSSFGVANVYNEINMKAGEVELTIDSIQAINVIKFEL